MTRMAYRIPNPDSFTKKHPASPAVPQTAKPAPARSTPPAARAMSISGPVEQAVHESSRALRSAGFTELADGLDTCLLRSRRERFTIAVVGEFSRGKSTFINTLLGHEYLPVGNLPTTAVMTRVRYHEKPVLAALNRRNEKVLQRTLSPDAWEGLTARNFGGEDFQGTAIAGVPDAWLQKTGIELIDTPGAGDLNQARARALSDALLGCDGAIITISAQAPLSMTEKLFIEERLIARKMPFLMLIITRLDLVPAKERAGVVHYVRSRLRDWGMNIPVYVPASLDMEDETLLPLTGMDRVKAEMESWITNPARSQLIGQWLLGRAGDALEKALSTLREKNALMEEQDAEKQRTLLEEKQQKLAQARLAWGELRLQMHRRCSECYSLLLEKVDDYAETITERLQYEAGHAPSPERWWTEDFPYRSKVELANMAAGIEQTASRQIQEDARWYAASIEKTFHAAVACRKEGITDKRHMGVPDTGKLVLEDLDKQRNWMRVGSTLLSISGFALFSALGFMPIVASMGIGTGTAILSEKFFKKRIEQQREDIKAHIAQCVPAFIQSAMADSERKLEKVYTNMIEEADRSQQTWMQEQERLIREVCAPAPDRAGVTDDMGALEKQLNLVHALI